LVVLSLSGAAIPSIAEELPTPKLSVDIINVDAPAFAALADARSAAGPSPITMMSHASKYFTSGDLGEAWTCHKQRA
jgi:hypothetical protein